MKLLNFAIIIFLFTATSCSNLPRSADSGKDEFIDSLISVMTLEEKIGQLTLYTSGWDVTGPVLRESYMEDVKTGRCGNIFNAHTVAHNTNLQKIAVEETRLGIPLLFGYDVIHGHRTIFPIPLAEACSWDLDLIEKSARYAAMEAAAAGINWNFFPVADICRDPRWGRIAEGAGEDPFLCSRITEAKVKGCQGEDLSDPLTLAACIKHFAAYGAPIAGRDYNSVDMSERTLREVYLPSYKAAIDAGVTTAMASFNDINGIPATGSKFLMKDILRKEWGFKGFVVTDYTGVAELVPHGYAENPKQAALLAFSAGIDVDMQSGLYQEYLAELVEENKIDEQKINRSVRRILGLKYDLGLFEDPYRYLDAAREQEITESEELMEHALISAQRSAVLLKNEPAGGKRLLPLSTAGQTIALIGPLADNQIDMMGTWHASGDASRVVTILQGLRSRLPGSRIHYVKGCETSGTDKSQFNDALSAARSADLVILALGENYIQSGEAASRSDISLPGVQQELMELIINTGKPVVVMVLAGRPLTIGWMKEHVPAILYTWHLGTRGGDAIADLLTGRYNPSGKLVVTFPRNVGQIPIYYNYRNTGRPFDPDNKYTTQYIDVVNDPLYPFGYGLSYTTFEYSDLKVEKDVVRFKESVGVSVQIKNTGDYPGEEIVQLYVRDLVGSVTRPVKELKGFQKTGLEPGESRTVTFTLSSDDLRFYDQQMNFIAEPGKFRVFVGTNSEELLEAGFELVEP